MKVIRAMKKLNFWSRKKRQKKYLLFIESPPPPSRPAPPPPPYYMLHCPYEPLLPSAPPLPSWLEYDEEMPSTSEVNPADFAASDNSTSKIHFSAVPEISDHPQAQPDTSYERYMVPNPVDDTDMDTDTAVVPQLKKLERGGGAFGCVVGFGVHLVRCVFPCFHIREEVVKIKQAV
ncbi:hypothetical protein Salat_1638200 [Sesamum alatum]|uniref:Uncharacterized protein n=1 Tax=Sesamum alatum TaxID=300844 RepID=A0AAE1Y680_9LAMI|nr:hypothetical protein Salat_1638200 [Sesamum alatum]